MNDSARLPQPDNALDRFSDWVGRWAAGFTLLMVIVTFVVVIMRYVFDAGLIWLQESVIWMHACVFMLGAAYTLRHEEHVRVDIFYRGMSERRRALIDAIGVVVFLFPFCAFLAIKAWDFVTASWSIREVSRESGGLAYPLIPLLKTFILIMPLTVSLQGLSLLLHSVRRLRAPDQGR